MKKLRVEISSSHSLREAFCSIFRRSGNPTSPRNPIQNADLHGAISAGNIFLLRQSLGHGKAPEKPCTIPSRAEGALTEVSRVAKDSRDPKNMK